MHLFIYVWLVTLTFQVTRSKKGVKSGLEISLIEEEGDYFVALFDCI